MAHKLIEQLNEAKRALFDGEEHDWLAASQAIDEAVSALAALQQRVEELEEALKRASANVPDWEKLAWKS